MSQVDSKTCHQGAPVACLSAAASADTSLTAPIGIEIPEAAETPAAVPAAVKDEEGEEEEGIRCSVNAKLFTCFGDKSLQQQLTQFNSSLRNSLKAIEGEQQLLTTAAAAVAALGENDDFDGLDLGDDGDPVDPSCLEPLGEILGVDADGLAYDGGGADTDNLIRLHGGDGGGGDDDNGEQTISATVNVATLDLTDPEAIHQHLSQLNDTVLRVKGKHI